MIRINLLPVKAAKRRATGQRQILVGSALVATVLLGLVSFHGWATAKNDRRARKLMDLNQEISKLKSEVGDFDAIKKQRDELQRHKEAILRLQSARSGPAHVMRQLSEILTRNKGPTYDKEEYQKLINVDPNARINPNWEPRRAWIISFSEKGGAVTLHCGAKSDEDVGEFLKRLKLSAFFSDVYWQQTQPQADGKYGVPYVTFDVTCRVNY